jgi:MoaA/NifB/PqqE/SkfB family radical SAM enzyme
MFDKFPKSLTQIAFGITDIYANPDFFKIMEYTRKNGVIPNYTTHGLDLDKNAVELTSKLCGAVAVSIVQKEKSYDAIKAFTDAGMKQVNCHYMLSMESYENLFSFLNDIKTDPRLAKLNAVVLLQYKNKNPYSTHHSLLDVDKYRKIIDYCNKHKINYGFDSCSAGIFMKSIEDHPQRKQLEQCAISCESSRMSFYIDTYGKGYPCSFCQGMNEWTEGIDVLKSNDFIKDIWNNEKLANWRNKLISTMKNGCANCPVYDLSY